MEEFIQQYGLVAVFFGCLLEGKVVALAGGVAAHRGLLPLPQVMMAAFAGSFLTDQVLYWIAHQNRLRIQQSRLAKTPAFTRAIRGIERFPNLFVLMFRFIYGIRLASPLAVGLSSMAPLRYFSLNMIAAVIWACSVTGLGYAFSQIIEIVFGKVVAIERVLVVLIIAAAILAWIVHKALSEKHNSTAR